MMNNQFHTSSFNPRHLNGTRAGIGETVSTHGYLPDPAQQTVATSGQWLTCQIQPHSSQQAVGQQNLFKRWPPTPTHPSTMQVTSTTTNPTEHSISMLRKQSPAATVTSSSYTHPMAYNDNNNKQIVSTSHNIHNLEKSLHEASPLQQQHALYVPLQSCYLPGAGNSSPRNCLLTNQPRSTQSVAMPSVPSLEPVSDSSASASVGPSTVVVDRINVCINNRYDESAQTHISGQQQQLSSTIPAIQNKTHPQMALPLPLIDSSCSSVSSSSYEEGGGGAGATVKEVESTDSSVVIDEPDSTTATPHTPPKTPETIVSPLASNTSYSALSSVLSLLQSPAYSSFSTCIKPSFKSNEAQSLPITPLSLPSPYAADATAQQPSSTLQINYFLQEDVFIKCQDGRFYLGTIIEQNHEQFLIRFDDQSEQWCGPEKMRKLGGGSCKARSSSLGGSGATNLSDSASAATYADNSSMCVACKRSNLQDIVEICERCGRGYHQGCTTEIVIGSGIWCCKRCAKPMKIDPPLKNRFMGKPQKICRQLPYHVDNLSWDEKHRVNEEQIYCYCGKPGKFDQNMLQCCKCRNWFHTQCMQNFKSKLLRGDVFFVFCCTVCNRGVEFVRRLQMDWVDVLHIALYNLRKHQQQKYHHLLKDIWPFVLEHRQKLPICAEWKSLPQTTLMERLKQTLNDYSERFVCGRELKRDPAYYALRHSGPPLTPKIFFHEDEELTDELLVNKYNLLPLTEEKKEERAPPPKNVGVYEFYTDDDDNHKQLLYEEETGVEVSTSEDDEIPIKQIIEKFKKQAEQRELKPPQPPPADDNANDAAAGIISTSMPTEQLDMVPLTRKRKAFRISKRYDHSNSNRNPCDLSSDENSSSSRGTSSLDLIIPPPVNFLGRNNPFLIATPKKSQQIKIETGNLGIGVTNIINGPFKLKIGGGAGRMSKEQPRMVSTIKRKLCAKDITVGLNQVVRRRRTRRLITDMKIINTTTINPTPSHYFRVYAKDLQPTTPPLHPLAPTAKLLAPSHGRLLRQRPQKSARHALNQNSALFSSSSSAPFNASAPMLDLKQSVNKYFGGAINRIHAGESFAIRAKRRIGNGQVQYLVEWTNGNR